jgi:hydrogenase maturation protease
MKTLILGIGNPILGDDGIGPRIIQKLQGQFSDPDIMLKETNSAGINLMEIIAGFDAAIVIDASQNGGKPGDINWMKPHDFEFKHQTFPLQHGIGLLQALELGKALRQQMPEEVDILAVETQDVTSFREGLTAEVEKAVPVALEQIRRIISSREATVTE